MARIIRESDLPALFRDFDAASVRSQSRYLTLVRVDLCLLVIGAALSSFNGSDASRPLIGWAGTASLFLGMACTIVLAFRGFERSWYGARAAAESTKSLAWKYMTRARPFDAPDREATLTLTHALRDILHARALSLSRKLDADATNHITPLMRDIRTRPVADRLQIYLEERVKDQCEWYSNRSSQNRSRETTWYVIVVAAQLLALIGALRWTLLPRLTMNFGGLFASFATAGLAWLQVKRHQELSQSYAVAAHELGLATTAAERIEDDGALSDFVNDAETAISREHTMWIARREVAGH